MAATQEANLFELKGMGIEITYSTTSVGGPDLVKGMLQIYRIKTLRGIARTVVF